MKTVALLLRMTGAGRMYVVFPGNNGEHAHDYDWAAKNPKGLARELTEQERIQHADILLERKKRKEKHL